MKDLAFTRVAHKNEISITHSSVPLQLIRNLLLCSIILVPLIFTSQTVNAYSDPKILALHTLCLTGGSVILFLFLRGNLHLVLNFKPEIIFILSVCLFISINILSIFAAHNIQSSISLLKNILSFMIVMVWVLIEARKRSFVLKVASLITVTCFILALYGMLQYAGFDIIKLELIRTPVSTLGNPNFVAQFYLVALPFVLLTIILAQRPRYRYFYGSVLILSLVHLLLVHSRGGYVGILVGAITFLLLRWIFIIRRNHNQAVIINRRQVNIITAGLVLIFGTFMFLDRGRLAFEVATIFTEEHETNRYRILTWKDTLRMIQDYPFLGVGIGNFRFEFPRYRSAELWQLQDPWGRIQQIRTHNDYLNMLAETGVPGFMSFLAVVIIAILYGIRALIHGKNREQAWILSCSLSAITATLAHSYFDFNLYNEASALYFWIAVGITVSISLDSRKRAFIIRSKSSHIPFFVAAIPAVFVVSLIIPSYYSYISSLHVRQGIVNQNHSFYERALQNYSSALSISPHNLDALSRKADLLRNLERYEEATQIYLRWMALEPYMIPIYTRLGYCYIKLNQYDKAQQFFSSGLKINPNSSVLLNNMANLLLLTRNYDRALEYFKRSDEFTDDVNTANRINYVRALMATHENKKARRLLIALFLEEPENLQILNMLAQCEARLGNTEKAQSLYIRLYLLSPDMVRQQLRQKFSDIFQKKGKFSEDEN